MITRLLVTLHLGIQAPLTLGAAPPTHYYAHEVVTDKYGVIAPWYQGQNGQVDFRIAVASETLRRYPWLGPPRCEIVLPEYLLSSFWEISSTGEIRTRPLTDWMNGDRGQLASYVLYVMPEYYRYSGDPLAVAHATMEADAFLRLALTDDHHPWPRFPISVPTKGKPYGQCDPKGFMQLDLAARAGWGLLRVYQLTGDTRYFEAVKHWGDLFAQKRNRTPGVCPWNRYANLDDMDWKSKDNKMTGGVVWVLYMLDELIRLGYTGKDNAIVEARNAGREYLRDTLLPAWWVNDTWGRQYWDWPCPVQVPNITAFVARYMMDNKDYFPNWRVDCRNIMSLCMNRTCVSPQSRGGVYHGAWAYPESCGCCGLCLLAGPQLMVEAWARYGVQADSEWARELARRQMILATYDCTPTGVAEDNIDGGVITNGAWFEAAHLGPLKISLGTMRWLPELLAPPRENHIVRSSAVINEVIYGKDRITWSTFDAPVGTVDLLRLAFVPQAVKADGQAIPARTDLNENGFIVRSLRDGDYLVSIRHDGARSIVVEGRDSQAAADDSQLAYDGQWSEEKATADFGGSSHVSSEAGSTATLQFVGSQVRVIGSADGHGGLAEVFLDGKKELAGIDCWSPKPMHQQVLYRRSGLSSGQHQLKVVAQGKGNPRSEGVRVCLDGAQWSNAAGRADFGQGGGPIGFQRMIFGYTGRQDYRDSTGNEWRPGCEFVVRSGDGTDSIEKAWWIKPTTKPIANTTDPELYRYGVHAPEFVVYFTVGPGRYQATLKFTAASERRPGAQVSHMSVYVNGQPVADDLDIAARAGGPDRAVDLSFGDMTPRNGMIEIRFVGSEKQVNDKTIKGDAFVQAIEIGPQPSSRE
jgi:hypothetical protein